MNASIQAFLVFAAAECTKHQRCKPAAFSVVPARAIAPSGYWEARVHDADNPGDVWAYAIGATPEIAENALGRDPMLSVELARAYTAEMIERAINAQ